jgi:hypothetical protein
MAPLLKGVDVAAHVQSFPPDGLESIGAAADPLHGKPEAR